ncbi:MAG TPA: glycine cleavage system protein H, partial [Candidatus Dormibacteraeota bacterium]|nr:glycine cleavage system protein H [Candidatus Dormibacteraeota bacterium]
NQSPYDKGWMVRIRLANPKEIETLLDAGAYEKHLGAHA